MMELFPAQELLDPLFEGYKLSLEDVVLRRARLVSCPDRRRPNNDQYSLLHLKLFSLHNHLYHNPWREDATYYIDMNFKVRKVLSDPTIGEVDGTGVVWQMPNCPKPPPGQYNVSMSFPSEDLAVVSDGAFHIYIAKTDTKRSREWKMVSGVRYSGESCFVIADSRCGKMGDKDVIYVVLQYIEEMKKDSDDQRSTGSFKTILEPIILGRSDKKAEDDTYPESWEIVRMQKLPPLGEVYYTALEPGCKALYVASDFPEEPVMEKPPNDSENKKEKEYMWQQTSKDITLTFRLPENTEKTDVTVIVNNLNFRVAYRNRSVLEGRLPHILTPSLTTWTVESGKLEVNLVKTEVGLMWKEVVVGNTKGEQIMDPALVEEVHQRLAHLCSNEEEVKESGCTPGFNAAQLEDCDIPENAMTTLERYDLDTLQILHQANLGGLQWLFNTPRYMEEVPSLCLRHDVDGCVWHPGIPAEGQHDWPINHIGTFLALGFVQASKRDRKFTTCPYDLSYVVICDAINRVYIYRQPKALESELRNRRSGQRISHTATQQLANLITQEEVLGIHGTRRMLYVLTAEEILTLHMMPCPS